MRILVLSFYYPPDLSAGSFRARAFVAAMAERLTGADKLEVLTSAPNRYSSFKQGAPAFEETGNVIINRIPVPRHKSGMLDQSLAFLRFAIGAWRKVGEKDYDMIWATSSRLFTAFLGALLARRRGIPLYLDMRDIFTEAIENILPGAGLKPVWMILRQVERFTIRTASRVNLISEGFAEHFKTMMPGKTYTFLPNGIDDEFLNADFEKKERSTRDIILYAGNVGEGQGLHRIIPPCAKRLVETHEFLVVGDGGARSKLETAIKVSHVDNVRVMPPVERPELTKLYKESDYLFLHLNDYEAFKKVLPSKIFEYAATGKPIIAGVSGYAKHFVEANIDNAAVFEPCDVEGFIEGLEQIRNGLTPRKRFIEQFKRRNIMGHMADDVLQCAKGAELKAVSSYTP
jgi:glycosyltransferase involved in cell wall biosynthesis